MSETKMPAIVEVGDKYLLWIAHYSGKAYTDQMGIEHPGYIVKEQIEVIVTEVRTDVPDLWTRKPEHIGIRAEAKFTKEMFQRNYSMFPSDSMTPNFYWDAITIRNNQNVMPVDSVQAYRWRSAPYVIDNKLAVPMADYIDICEIHKIARYKRERFEPLNGCIKCTFNMRD